MNNTDEILHENSLGNCTSCENCGKIQLTTKSQIYVLERYDFLEYSDYISSILNSIQEHTYETVPSLLEYSIDPAGITFSSPSINCFLKLRPREFRIYSNLIIQSRLSLEIRDSLNQF
jgi:hypothetical protein